VSTDDADRFVLALAGAPASGKTTVARALATQTGARRVSFGDLVRTEAASRGDSLDRDSLQHLGQQLLDDLGPDAFCRAALRAAGAALQDRPVIWDGVRHLRVLTALGSLYNTPVRLVYLQPPEGPRRERFARQASSPEQLRRWEQDATEQEADQLADVADLRCPAATTLKAISQTLAFLSLAP
jgi:adenylate kinase family enzyme